MIYTAAHWGAYRVVDDGRALAPLDDDPLPSRIGRGWLSAATDPHSRILRPAVRRGWLDGDGGAGRGIDSYVEIEWDAALDLAARELDRVRGTFGNGAIFAGSYGWASAGRFHHAQSQLRRFLNVAGGFVGARDTYSHAAAEVMFPHLLGLSNRAFQDVVTSFSEVQEHCELVLAFGGISPRTAQVASSGTTRHEVGAWLEALAAGRTRFVNVSPLRGDLAGAEWLPIRPGTDVALMLALAFEIVASGREDRAFLARCTSGWETLRAYLTGETDGVAKSAEWAAALCDIDAGTIRALARELTERRSMISLTWGMQRADHGEQPLWAGLALACVIGQIGRPGCGFAFGYGSTTPVGRDTQLVDWPSMPQGVNPVSDFIPVARIADMLLNPGERYTYNLQHRTYPDIRLVWWVGGNPFHHHQDLRRLDKAWKRPQTVIVNEHSWTATARRADIVLPATTPFERDDIPCFCGCRASASRWARRATTIRSSPRSRRAWGSVTPSPRGATPRAGCAICGRARKASPSAPVSRCRISTRSARKAASTCRWRRSRRTRFPASSPTLKATRCARNPAASRWRARRSPPSPCPTAPATRHGWSRRRA
jgi:biotin/methionine sulfoxide reductase